MLPSTSLDRDAERAKEMTSTHLPDQRQHCHMETKESPSPLSHLLATRPITKVFIYYRSTPGEAKRKGASRPEMGCWKPPGPPKEGGRSGDGSTKPIPHPHSPRAGGSDPVLCVRRVLLLCTMCYMAEKQIIFYRLSLVLRH